MSDTLLLMTAVVVGLGAVALVAYVSWRAAKKVFNVLTAGFGYLGRRPK